MNELRGAVLIVSGPSGCGKSTLLKEVIKNIPNLYFSISTTTREPREAEEDGIDYFFVSKEKFEEDIKDANFLEYAKVHDNYYGTSLKPVIEALNAGKLVIFDIDVQGHKIIRKKLQNLITSVFITTPTKKILEQRLIARATDSEDSINKRVENARVEMEEFLDYDYLIVNENLNEAKKQILAIATAARVKSKLYSKDEIVNSWLEA
ncbi:guanylate kinase [Aliarcobacter skirrowii]|jgi:guanylate kinase|uniref:Guanylate kinase n=2 Tax=Aliarcobacter skirrowii TaxID=28200 RepID=A0AAD0SNJ7_9BACT|nr:guanylate kinase [Aliarcobacter skirrowii]AXX85398.1 deoxyguanylate kinase / guanylate kinase [Aliarcobacter skirrowii CCUG 10374]AZL54465.1 guanylate kinase [Aliarcobacter skirrowii]KAB0621190.1 guanylate kinase [Aliarcobacter skirrowii CCUG 10374]MCT7447386.1 guanylate kinase [Aliarcobacter skirrowii]MDD2508136.1 guanylate kinase [Aliarcobacter skirrowii]